MRERVPPGPTPPPTPIGGPSAHDTGAARASASLDDAAPSTVEPLGALSPPNRRVALPDGPEAFARMLAAVGYHADLSLATTVFLSLRLTRPVLLEGEAGVGKTEIARAIAACLDRELIRLSCYEGLDVAQALYEWNYPKQVLAIRMAETAGEDGAVGVKIYDERFLLKRPLLRALEPSPRGAPVLLIDELDRADEPFEAFLLELLADFRVTIPELGAFRAEEPPIVVLTSNRTRDVHDAVRRRCLYHWVDYPTVDRETRILRARLPHMEEGLVARIVAFTAHIRSLRLVKPPGIAEALDWARCLEALAVRDLSRAVVDATLGALVKYPDDAERVRGDALVAGLS